MDNIIYIPVAVMAFFVLETVLLGCARLFGIYTIVNEREAKVFVLFGEVLGVISTPGIHFLIEEIGLKALIVNIFGETQDRKSVV